MIKIYGIKNCDTMKKAFVWLDNRGIEHEFTDYKEVAMSKITDWNARSNWETLLNKKGLTWRNLSMEEREDLTEEKALELMAKYPCLIKRPVLDTGDNLIIGFKPEIYEDALP